MYWKGEIMKKVLLLTLFVFLFTSASATFAYDAGMAKTFEKLFAKVVGPDSGKALHLMSPEAFLKKVVTGTEYVVLDVRTPDETSIFGMNCKNKLIIPIGELFKAENLKKIPADNNIFVVCSSGMRAAAVGTALRALGFAKVFILKGGIKGLAAYAGSPKVFGKLKSKK